LGSLPPTHLEIRLPDDFPSGPAEVIVLADSQSGSSTEEARRDMLAVLEELRTTKLTEEEERVLDDFERFRQEHPLDLTSLTEDEQ
jgi:hypothetical protein